MKTTPIRWNDFEFHADLGPILSGGELSVSTERPSAIKDDDRNQSNQETRRGMEPARMASNRSKLENSTDQGRIEAAEFDGRSVLQPGEVS